MAECKKTADSTTPTSEAKGASKSERDRSQTSAATSETKEGQIEGSPLDHQHSEAEPEGFPWGKAIMGTVAAVAAKASERLKADPAFRQIVREEASALKRTLPSNMLATAVVSGILGALGLS